MSKQTENSIWRSSEDEQSARRLAVYIAKHRAINGIGVFSLLDTYMMGIGQCLKCTVSHHEMLKALILSSDPETKTVNFKEFESTLGSHTETKPVGDSKWKIILPSNFLIARGSGRFRCHINKMRFSLDSSDRISRLYEQNLPLAGDHIDYRIRKRKNHISWPGFIVFECKGPSCGHAINSVMNELWCLRGVLELVVGGNTTAHHYPAKTMRSIEHETWAIALAENGQVDYVPFNWLKSSYSIHLDVPKPVEIDDLRIRKIKYVSRSVREWPRKSISELVAKCLQLLTSSLDQLLDADHFMHLWQIAEAITMSESHGGHTDVVCGRFASFLVLDGVQEQDAARALKHLAQARNHWVHNGSSHEVLSESLNNEFRLACCHAIWWLVYRCEDFDTVSKLSMWYKLRTTSNRELELMTDVAKIVQSTRC